MKSKLSIFAAVLLVCSFMIVVGFAESAKVTASGQGTVSLQADTVSFTIGIRTEGTDISETQQKNKQDMTKLIEALKKQGVGEKDMLTTYYDVNLNQSYGDSNAEDTYSVNNMLYIVLKDIDALNDVLDAAIENGANTLWSLNFSSSKEAEAYDKALEIAVQKATKSANVLAKASSRKLGDIIEISQTSYGPAQYDAFNNMELVAAAEAKDAGGLISGDVSVTATVTVTFELNER